MSSMVHTLWIILGIATLMLTTIFNGLSIFHAHNLHRRRAPNYTYNGNDFPPELPIPTDVDVTLRFDNDHYKITSDDQWVSTMPPNQGRIHLGLEGREFEVAMYRQLHCLNAVRLAYLVVHDQPSPLAQPDFLEAETCIDELRQAILCTADITLDPAHITILEDGTVTPSSTGVGVDHRCRDWTQVRAFVEGNREGTTGFNPTIV